MRLVRVRFDAMRARLLAVVATGIGAVSVAAGASLAEAKSCRPATTANGLGIVGITPEGTTCAVARTVAIAWGADERLRSRSVLDAQERRWRCRVRQLSTGTDADYTARTKVACSYRTKRVRFQLAS